MSTDQQGNTSGEQARDKEQKAITNLTQLSEIDYFRARKDAAKFLEVTPSDLDKLVKKARQPKAEKIGNKSDVMFDEIKPWSEPVDGAALLNDIVMFIKRYVICEPHTADAAALWIAFSWLIDAVTVAPIANITAPLPNCGKSTLLDLMERLCYQPLKADNISPAALFRSIEKWRPTLLIDEVDAFLKDNEDARGILNSGHKRNGFVLRVVGDTYEPRRFSTWGAKALCGIGTIASTLQSRSITLELRRKLPHESVENLRHANPAEVQALQQRLARFSSDAYNTVSAARPEPIAGLHNRAQDNWEPLLAIAQAAGADWPKKTHNAAQMITGTNAAHDAPDTNTELLADIREVFKQKHMEKIFTADLLQALCEDEEAPWATWNRGKPITARQLSSRLSEFSIKPDDVRIGGAVRKGYTLAKFRDAFARYLPD